ncbi:decapping and exoribonuclease protein-like [Strongylocentrotus purpuratus]|uniref:Decapping nuclease n=1 Tax=Strongylocentrotus purpuratus TaxID=7668 RepID=A0A7M7NUN6_STRPU|nr:decapping and exoribonuclease protein-like [Strongylocentrotus purpuratus]
MKALNWWAPNVMAGIPEIYCGLRDDHRRTIERIETIKTKELATNQNCWDSGHCIQTLESVLSQIKELVPEDDPNSFKRAVLTIRSVDGGSGMNTVEIQKRNGQEGDRFVEEDDIQLIFKGNE